MDAGIFSNLSYVVSNEGDWPDVGFATGFRNATFMPDLIYDGQVISQLLVVEGRVISCSTIACCSLNQDS